MSRRKNRTTTAAICTSLLTTRGKRTFFGGVFKSEIFFLHSVSARQQGRTREKERERGQTTTGGREEGAEGAREERTRGQKEIQGETRHRFDTLFWSFGTLSAILFGHVSWWAPWKPSIRAKLAGTAKEVRRSWRSSEATAWTSFEFKATQRENGWDGNKMAPVC